MAITIRDYLNKAKFVRDNILNETETIVYKNEDAIINLNVDQIESGIGSDGKILKNSNDVFSGTYSLSTNLLNPNKKAGSLYNFFETGAFLGGFKIELSQDGTKVIIYSTGTGTGDKASFFNGYDNLYGLYNRNSLAFNRTLKEELDKFIKKYL
jgi:hypothetical protein